MTSNCNSCSHCRSDTDELSISLAFRNTAASSNFKALNLSSISISITSRDMPSCQSWSWT
uniref:Uncharacterized protein n=1 Tax=Oryza meridionalis TaxID=40149 RepID=A0A0E0D7U5_9ORYZ